MEPIAIYIILAIAVTAILLWAMSLALRSNDYNDRYPPHGPYPYPYPPYPYPPPAPSDGPILSMALVIFLGFAVFRSCEKKEKPDPPPYDGGIGRDTLSYETALIGGTDEMPGGNRDLAPPAEYDRQWGKLIADPAPNTPIDLYRGYFVQKGAFSSDANALRVAQKMQTRYPETVLQLYAGRDFNH